MSIAPGRVVVRVGAAASIPPPAPTPHGTPPRLHSCNPRQGCGQLWCQMSVLLEPHRVLQPGRSVRQLGESFALAPVVTLLARPQRPRPRAVPQRAGLALGRGTCPFPAGHRVRRGPPRARRPTGARVRGSPGPPARPGCGPPCACRSHLSRSRRGSGTSRGRSGAGREVATSRAGRSTSVLGRTAGRDPLGVQPIPDRWRAVAAVGDQAADLVTDPFDLVSAVVVLAEERLGVVLARADFLHVLLRGRTAPPANGGRRTTACRRQVARMKRVPVCRSRRRTAARRSRK